MSRLVSLLILSAAPILVRADAGDEQSIHSGHGMKHEKTAGHASALGKPGDEKKITRTIEVAMGDDMRFSPARVQVKRGETIRFAVKNNGKMTHEMVLGSPAELKQHAAMMRKFPQMRHSDPNAISVEPSRTGELKWQFNKAGSFGFACLVPGHFEAGMRGAIVVRR
jgi:uncharacterized cupredoxin-like copper-binding protein